MAGRKAELFSLCCGYKRDGQKINKLLKYVIARGVHDWMSDPLRI